VHSCPFCIKNVDENSVAESLLGIFKSLSLWITPWDTKCKGEKALVWKGGYHVVLPPLPQLNTCCTCSSSKNLRAPCQEGQDSLHQHPALESQSSFYCWSFRVRLIWYCPSRNISNCTPVALLKNLLATHSCWADPEPARPQRRSKEVRPTWRSNGSRATTKAWT